MLTKINRTEEIKARFIQEGGSISVLKTEEQKAAINTFNEEMKEIKREYKVKETESETSASYVCLTD